MTTTEKTVCSSQDPKRRGTAHREAQGSVRGQGVGGEGMWAGVFALVSIGRNQHGRVSWLWVGHFEVGSGAEGLFLVVWHQLPG